MRASMLLSFFALGWLVGLLGEPTSIPTPLNLALVAVLACFAAFSTYMDHARTQELRLQRAERAVIADGAPRERIVR